MLKFRKLSLQRKQMLIMTLTSIVVLLFACSAFIVYDTISFRKELVENVSVLADAIASNSATTIDLNDSQAAREMLSALQANDNVVSACIYARDGHVFAVFQRDGSPPFVPPAVREASQEFIGDQLHVFRPVKRQGHMVGTIFIASDLMDLWTHLNHDMGIMGLVFLVSLLAALALSSRLQRLVSTPILQLAKVARSVAVEKNYALRAVKQSEDELGQLVDTFNEMLAQIQQRDTALRSAHNDLEMRVDQRTSELAISNEALQRQQTELRVLFDFLPAMICFKDTGNGIQRVNQKFADHVGKSVEEIEGKSFIEIDPQEADRYLEDDLEVIHTGEPKLGVIEAVRGRDGEERWLQKDRIPVRDSGGKVSGIVVMAQDITERKRTEEAMRESEERFSSAFEYAPIGVALVSPDGRWLKVNRAICDLVGYTSAELLARTFQDITHPEDLGNDLENLNQLVAGKIQSYKMEKRYIHAQGNFVAVLLNVSLIRDRNGQPLYFISQIQDITERKREAVALLESKRFLESTLDALSSHIAILDEQGMIIEVNTAWDRFASENEANGKCSVGDNYLDVCDLATGRFSEEGATVAHGIRSVMAGQSAEFHLEYPCHSAQEQRWFVVRVTRFSGAGPVHVVVAHENISQRKLAEAELGWKTAFLEAQVNSSLDGILVVNPEGKKILQNQLFTGLLNIPWPIAQSDDDAAQLQWVTSTTKDPVQFGRKVEYLVSHPNESSEDEIEFKDGTVLDRHSAPVVGQDGKYYGRIWTFRDITERKHGEIELAYERDLLRNLLDNSSDYIYFKDPKSRFTKSSTAHARHFGLSSAEEMVGKTDFDFFSHEHAQLAFDSEQEILRTGRPVFNLEERETRFDGQDTWVLSSKMPWRDQTGNIIGTMGISRDITERKKLEIQLLQSQKMETIGKLAGGIAHEFNSILTAIIGHCELLRGDLPEGSPLVENATEISKAAVRAATLTRQLLAYGRKQVLLPETLDLNRVVARMDGILHHLMGVGVDTQIVSAPGLHAVKADAGQIEQVIVYMVINAREAMPNGGKLTLETANVTLHEEGVGPSAELKPGDYVMLAISDSGTGMSAEVKERIFEPFFTTKDIGQGTGLGLSTCYGIVKQSGGHISVYSEPGRGTTFKIYLPQVESPTNVATQRIDSPGLPRGTETILLVEDDPALRGMAATLLGRLGYKVLTAANGVEALRLKQQQDVGHIDLLFTDVVMPQMSGKELAERMQVLSPHTRVLFTSAYTELSIAQQGALQKGAVLLQKPFTPSALARNLREVLDQPDTLLPDPKKEIVDSQTIAVAVPTLLAPQEDSSLPSKVTP